MAEDSAKVISKARRRRMMIGGPSHHFFLTLRNSQSSPAMEALLAIFFAVFIYSFLL
jgi:hypothetical protein